MLETPGRIGGQMHKQIKYQNGPPDCPPFLSVSLIFSDCVVQSNNPA